MNITLSEFDMSNPHLGLNKPLLQTPTVGSQVLPLAPALPTPQQGSSSLTRLANTSQGGRNSVRSSTNTTISDSPMMASLLSTGQGNPQPAVSSSSPPSSRKRKLLPDEINSYRKRIRESFDNKQRRLENKYAERSAFVCFLDGSGHLSDYSSWRARLPVVPLQNFLKTSKLDSANEAEDLFKFLQVQNHSLLQSALTGNKNGQQGTNTETPRVSPASSPDKSESLSSKLQKTPMKVTTPTKNNASPSENNINTSSSSNQEQIVEKAKQEAYVMQRIGELQKDGLWAERRLPKVHELPRTKAHWDYLLEEMAWLAADFAQERKWKKAAAKKCARMVQKHFQEKEALAQKAIKAQELHLKRIASFIAKEIKTFWNNVEKLVEFKQKTRLEAKRKKALDQHLSFIVDQTEKYSSLVAEGLNTSKQSPPKHHSDVEFEPEGSSDDDEETIAKEEAMDIKMNTQEEIDALKRESEVPLEDLLSGYLDQRDSLGSPVSQDDENEEEELDEDDAEYKGSNNDTSDDEETIHEQEKAEGRVDYKQEINELEEEGNMSIEQLKAKYGIQEPPSTNAAKSNTWNGENNTRRRGRKKEESESEYEESESTEEDDEEEDEEEEEESEEEQSNSEVSEKDEEDSALKSLLNDINEAEKPKADKDKAMNDVAALAQSLQPKGNTLSSTSVVTKVPFLLKHTLREYQHIGLDWLVTMYDRKLNGILADEMGLGKTIQTIALIAHLACEKGNWGPHLIIVPTSVMLNWEMEFKKWCPAFKILTYYGSQKERKLKRSGWTKPNAFHICITSYKLVIQDHQSFRRKKWKYLILDEAQNIKNFKSQRWQLLLNFQSQRRLLLTGTPLQNNLMELWSLMHFLMPNVFESHREFKEWFSNPVTGMIEGNSEYNEHIIKRLHKVLRPFLLRRLKSEVETQMPKKYEHILMCRLSNRQRYLYDDFMSRAKTRETLATGSLLSVINVLMQLRKVCNHPNLFEVRPTVSPFQMEPLDFHVPSIVWSAIEYDPLKNIDLMFLNLKIIEFELWLLGFVAHTIRKYKVSPDFICAIDSQAPEPPPCPKGRVKIRITKKVLPQPIQASNPIRPIVHFNNHRINLNFPATKVGTSPLIKLGQPNAQGQLTLRLAAPSPGQMPNYLQLLQPANVKALSAISLATSGKNDSTRILPQFAQLVNTPSGRQFVLSPQPVITPVTGTCQRIMVTKQAGVAKLVTPVTQLNSTRPIMRVPPLNIPNSTAPVQNCVTTNAVNATNEVTATNGSSSPGVNSISSPKKISTRQSSSSSISKEDDNLNTSLLDLKDINVTVEEHTLVVLALSHLQSILCEETGQSYMDVVLGCRVEHEEELENYRKRKCKEKLELIARVNETRCLALPIYGENVVSSLIFNDVPEKQNWSWAGYAHCSKSAYLNPKLFWVQTTALSHIVHSVEDRVADLADIFSRFVLFVPPVSSRPVRLHVPHPPPSKTATENTNLSLVDIWLRPKLRLLHGISSAMSTQFPDRRLIQYDCGKLQSLDRLLRNLKTDHHRVLIFTQMTRMLDVLEAFLNFHGHIYLRLDGTTKVEQRQLLMDRFNADKRIFCFILSTRSGGVGINLTGADTVIFYDSDWNPTMDAQAQDRCHRIGQTRDVHIYRLVSEKTVEENILKKANQKRMLGDVAIEGGNFTTAYFKSSTIQDLFNVDTNENDASRRMAEVLHKELDKPQVAVEAQVPTDETKGAIGALESALAQAEDETDVAAAKVAKAEAAAELAEFDENIPIDNDSGSQEMSRAELELNALMNQLNGVEKYAIKFMEETESVWSKEQLAAAEAEIEQQKKEWEAGRLAALRNEDGERREEEGEITYSGVDARNQLWISNDGTDIMPMWCPPTPPQDEGDIYIDQALGLLYEPLMMTEEQLPPVHIKKEKKRSRFEAGLPEGRNPTKIRSREDSTLLHAPRSLFDRPSPALIKMRQELKLQRYRGLLKPTIPSITTKPSLPIKPLPEPEHVPDWLIQEDWSILQAIQQYQELLNLNLIILSPGHTPNWDFVADVVNMTSRSYRSAKQCRNRYEAVIMPREEGKLVFDSPKKQKKNKSLLKLPQMKSGRPLRTSQLFQQDNNSSLTNVMNSRFDAIRSVSNRRAPTVKPLLVDPAMKNPKHAEVLAECSIDYERPLTPVEVAAKRADRIAKEKQQALSQQATGNEPQIVLRLQQQPGLATKSTSTASPTITAVVTTQATTTPPRTVSLQDLGVRSTIAVTSSQVVQTIAQRTPSAGLVTVQASTAAGSPVVKGGGTKTLTQLQSYRQQQIFLRQQQHQQQLRVLQSKVAGQKVSVAVSPSSATQRVQQVKAGGVTRTMSESEMVALLKRQAAKGTAAGTLSSAQILAQASNLAQQTGATGQVATVKSPVAGLTLPQIKSALSAGLKGSPQQIRHLSLQQQIIAQHRKVPQQKVAQIGQANAGQLVPHALFAKTQAGSSQQARVIPVTTSPQQSIKQAIQVVTGGAGGTTRGVATIDSSNRAGAQLLGAIKAGTAQQQQAILTQVSAVLQGSGGVRQPVRIQATSATPIVAVAVSQAPTVLTLPTPPHDSQQQQQ